MPPKIQENDRRCVKLLVFLSNPRLPFKASQSVGQKNRPHCTKSNRGISFPGPFLLKLRPSEVSLGSRQLANVAKDPVKRAQVVQVPTFSKPPSASFKVSQSVSQKKRPDRAKSNRGFSDPGPFLLRPRPSQVCLMSRKLANVAKDPGKRAQVGQVFTFPEPPSARF